MCTLLPLGVRKNLSWSAQFAFYKNICYNKDVTIENRIKKGRLFDAFNSEGVWCIRYTAIIS